MWSLWLKKFPSLRGVKRRSNPAEAMPRSGLLRRYAPRNDDAVQVGHHVPVVPGSARTPNPTFFPSVIARTAKQDEATQKIVLPRWDSHKDHKRRKTKLLFFVIFVVFVAKKIPASARASPTAHSTPHSELPQSAPAPTSSASSRLCESFPP